MLMKMKEISNFSGKKFADSNIICTFANEINKMTK